MQPTVLGMPSNFLYSVFVVFFNVARFVYNDVCRDIDIDGGSGYSYIINEGDICGKTIQNHSHLIYTDDD